MTVDPDYVKILQPTLFETAQQSSTALELFPKVWSAAEALVDSDLTNRQAGLKNLEEMNAARYSSLVAYLLFTRLTESDLELRKQIVRILAGVIEPDQEGRLASEEIRQGLFHCFSHLRSDQVYAMLEVAVSEPAAEPAVIALIKTNCQACDFLVEILSDRREPFAIRRQAAHFIGQIGFVEAVGGLEKNINRIESRINGQQSFAINPADPFDEARLLPTLKSVLAILQAP